MMTHPLFRDDAYLREAEARVIGHTPEGGIVVDQSVFYATSGGQPGDSGLIDWEGGRLTIATAVKVEGGAPSRLCRPRPGRCPRLAPICASGSTGTAAIAICACTPPCTFCPWSFRCR